VSYTQTSALHNPNVVKVLLAAGGRGLYFSRSALPHVRDVDPAQWCAHTSFRGHIGIYAYRADVLLRWHQLPISPLENLEKLEQLWLIEAGIRIDTPSMRPPQLATRSISYEPGSTSFQPL
jgi:3-deoxy-manno-octulosonate cytidylyltransferase (CMP-KDO synthetase)